MKSIETKPWRNPVQDEHLRCFDRTPLWLGAAAAPTASTFGRPQEASVETHPESLLLGGPSVPMAS